MTDTANKLTLKADGVGEPGAVKLTEKTGPTNGPPDVPDHVPVNVNTSVIVLAHKSAVGIKKREARNKPTARILRMGSPPLLWPA